MCVLLPFSGSSFGSNYRYTLEVRPLNQLSHIIISISICIYVSFFHRGTFTFFLLLLKSIFSSLSHSQSSALCPVQFFFVLRHFSIVRLSVVRCLGSAVFILSLPCLAFLFLSPIRSGKVQSSCCCLCCCCCLLSRHFVSD